MTQESDQAQQFLREHPTLADKILEAVRSLSSSKDWRLVYPALDLATDLSAEEVVVTFTPEFLRSMVEYTEAGLRRAKNTRAAQVHDYGDLAPSEVLALAEKRLAAVSTATDRLKTANLELPFSKGSERSQLLHEVGAACETLEAHASAEEQPELLTVTRKMIRDLDLKPDTAFDGLPRDLLTGVENMKRSLNLEVAALSAYVARDEKIEQFEAMAAGADALLQEVRDIYRDAFGDVSLSDTDVDNRVLDVVALLQSDTPSITSGATLA